MRGATTIVPSTVESMGRGGSASGASGPSGSSGAEVQQIQTLTANGSTIQYVTDGNPEQAAVAVLQAVFGTSAPLISTSGGGGSTISGGSVNNLRSPQNLSTATTLGNAIARSTKDSLGSASGQSGTTYYYESLLTNGGSVGGGPVGVVSSGSSQNSSNIPPSPTSPTQSQTTVTLTSGSSVAHSMPTQIVAQSGNTFLVQSNNIDAESAPITHTTRASPITVQWLLDNYETAEGVSLPRCALYYHYLKHCKENELEPVNAASFGKLIRSVFLGLKTRRLGTRGNSKYHYYGIRIKPGSPLNHVSLDFLYQPSPSSAMAPAAAASTASSTVTPVGNGGGGTNQSSVSSANAKTATTLTPKSATPMKKSPSGQFASQNATKSGVGLDSMNHGTSGGPATSGVSPSTGGGVKSGLNSGSVAGSGGANSSGNSNSELKSISQNISQYQQYVGQMTNALPFPTLQIPADCVFPDGIMLDDLNEFEQLYIEHCEAIREAISDLKLMSIENIWQCFWKRNLSGMVEPISHLKAEDVTNLEARLPKRKQIKLCEVSAICEYVKNVDEHMYQVIVDFLIANVLRPIPSPLTQAIRNFAKNLEAKMRDSLGQDYSQNLKIAKLSALCAFCQTLRRYTSLNHLAQAARAVLQNSAQITQMLADLNRVDFQNVQDQASWVCGCDESLIKHIEADFKRSLQLQRTLEQWAAWLEGVVEQVLLQYSASDSPTGHTTTGSSSPLQCNPETFAKTARQFLLNWSFYSSMVIRDLTLRSAASFGSFHLIRLLYDEYMFYLVEHKVAQVLGKSPVAVMAQYTQKRSKESVANNLKSNLSAAAAANNSPSYLSSNIAVIRTAGSASNLISSNSSQTARSNSSLLMDSPLSHQDPPSMRPPPAKSLKFSTSTSSLLQPGRQHQQHTSSPDNSNSGAQTSSSLTSQMAASSQQDTSAGLNLNFNDLGALNAHINELVEDYSMDSLMPTNAMYQDTAIPMNLVQPGGATSSASGSASSRSQLSGHLDSPGSNAVSVLSSRHLQQGSSSSASNGHLGAAAAVLEEMAAAQSVGVGSSSVSRYRQVIQQLHPPLQQSQQTNNVLMSAATSNALYSASINGFDAVNDLTGDQEDFEDCESDNEDTIDMTRAEMSLARDQFEDAMHGDAQSLLEHANIDPMTYSLALASSAAMLSGIDRLTTSVGNGASDHTMDMTLDPVGSASEFLDVKPSQIDLFSANALNTMANASSFLNTTVPSNNDANS